MAYPSRRGAGAPGVNGADGKQVEIQNANGWVQWRYVGDASWQNLIALSSLEGSDGRNVNLRVNSGWIQWQHDGDSSWLNLMNTADMKGDPGQPNILTVGSVQQLPAGSAPQVTITGESPEQVINFSMPEPRDGLNGINAAMKIGAVSSLPAGSQPTVQITGSAPEQTINFGIPLPFNGTNGKDAPNNTITIGTVTALPAGSSPTASMTGSSPNQVLNLGLPIPMPGANGANNTLNIGTVTSGAASASITGNSPNQTLNLVLPPGPPGTNGTNGTNGVGIASQAITYQQSASGTTPPTGAWTTSIPSVTKGTYLWTRIVLTLTDGSSSTSYAVAYQAADGLPGANGTNGTNGANYSPGIAVSRTVSLATPYQHTDITKPFKVVVNARSTQTVTVAGLVSDKVELRIGPNAAAVAPGGAGGLSIGVWESGITGIALMVGAAVLDGGQLTADAQAGWYFQINRVTGSNASIVSCFTQSMS